MADLDQDPSPAPPLGASLPDAVVVPAAGGAALARWWPLGGVAGLLVTLWLLLQGSGPVVTLVADDGHGLGAGDPVRYRGLEVGEVGDVRLTDLGVEVDLRLAPGARGLARAGTRFWIVRPMLSLDAVTGLDTLLGSRYVTLDPGPPEAEPRRRFTALPAPPVDALAGERPGLDLILEARERHGLQPGAAVTFRGIPIGAVTAVRLSSDSTLVEVYVTVRAAYARLIRERSVFWETGGVEFDLTLTRGAELGLDSLRSALVGAIAVATPPEGGAAAAGGSRFGLQGDAEPEWLQWTAALPVGEDLVAGAARPAESFGATLTWEEGRLLRSEEVREGWCCATPLGLVGPADLLTVPADAREGSAVLEVAGRRLGLAELAGQGLVEDLGPGGLRLVSPEAFRGHWGLLAARAVKGTRRLESAEDLLVFSSPGAPPLPISAARLSVGEAGVATLVGEPAVPEGWHGGQVLSRADGALLGLLVAPGGGATPRVVPLDAGGEAR